MELLEAAHPPVLLPLLAAFTSAATFGLSTSLQHRVAGATVLGEGTGTRFLARLVRRPSWVIGIGLSVVAFCLHAVAIALGGLTLVQPVIVSGVVFAVLIRAGLDRRRPSWRELAWTVVTWAGLASFISAVHADPAPAMPRSGPALGFTALGVLAAGAAVRLAEAARTPERRGLWFGVAAGVLFGLVAGLLKVVTAIAATAPLEALLRWQPWVMVACGLWAMGMNQRAYQVTRLSVSMPILNVVDVVVALGFAVAVFGEPLASSPGALASQVVGLGAMGLGVHRLARGEERLEPPSGRQAPAAARVG